MALQTFSVTRDDAKLAFSIEYPTTSITGHPYIDHLAALAIFNKSGSGKIVKVIMASSAENVAATVANTTITNVTTQRCSAVTAGKGFLTPFKLDSGNAALPSQVLIYKDPAAVTLTSSAILNDYPHLANENDTRALGFLTSGRYPLQSVYRMQPNSDLQRVVLREGEGLAVHGNASASNVHRMGISIAFRVVGADDTWCACDEFALDASGGEFVLWNGAGSGVVLEVLDVRMRQIGTDVAQVISFEYIDTLDESTGEAVTPFAMDSANSLGSSIVVRQNCRVRTGGSKFGAIIPSAQILPQFGTFVGTGPGIASLKLQGMKCNMWGPGIYRDFAPEQVFVIREGWGMAWFSRTAGCLGRFERGFRFTVQNDTDYPAEGDVRDDVVYNFGTQTGTLVVGGGGAGYPRSRVVNQ